MQDPGTLILIEKTMELILIPRDRFAFRPVEIPGFLESGTETRNTTS